MGDLGIELNKKKKRGLCWTWAINEYINKTDGIIQYSRSFWLWKRTSNDLGDLVTIVYVTGCLQTTYLLITIDNNNEPSKMGGREGRHTWLTSKKRNLLYPFGPPFAGRDGPIDFSIEVFLIIKEYARMMSSTSDTQSS